jgi:hypothetical protein
MPVVPPVTSAVLPARRSLDSVEEFDEVMADSFFLLNEQSKIEQIEN